MQNAKHNPRPRLNRDRKIVRLASLGRVLLALRYLNQQDRSLVLHQASILSDAGPESAPVTWQPGDILNL